jgi:hypothetical protein
VVPPEQCEKSVAPQAGPAARSEVLLFRSPLNDDKFVRERAVGLQMPCDARFRPKADTYELAINVCLFGKSRHHDLTASCPETTRC